MPQGKHKHLHQINSDLHQHYQWLKPTLICVDESGPRRGFLSVPPIPPSSLIHPAPTQFCPLLSYSKPYPLSPSLDFILVGFPITTSASGKAQTFCCPVLTLHCYKVLFNVFHKHRRSIGLVLGSDLLNSSLTAM